MITRSLFKKIIPKPILSARHFLYAWWGSVKYKHPSEELLVIGVTGTSGKSSTIFFLRHVLESAGYKVGSLSTVDFYIAGKETLNNKKMTMLGKTAIQEQLRAMVNAGCNIAIIETTSEGAVQYRHRFINYDFILLTNLYPEHIESHGSFENYKAAKLRIFADIANSKRKKKNNLPGPAVGNLLAKTAIINGNVEFAKEFLEYRFEKKYLFGVSDRHSLSTNERMDVDDQVYVSGVRMDNRGVRFAIDGRLFTAPLFGEYNASNLAGVVAVARSLAMPWEQIQDAVAKLHGVPGRIEFIPEAVAKGFQVIVDYAFEPVAMAALYAVVELFKPARIIHVFGSTGGGRDVSRRFTVGEFAGTHADICIITNEDPYDDDPSTIIADVASAVAGTGKKEGRDMLIISDRREAIARAVALAQPRDIILVTGKGSEQAMAVQGELIPWDDRKVVREVLATASYIESE